MLLTDFDIEVLQLLNNSFAHEVIQVLRALKGQAQLDLFAAEHGVAIIKGDYQAPALFQGPDTPYEAHVVFDLFLRVRRPQHKVLDALPPENSRKLDSIGSHKQAPAHSALRHLQLDLLLGPCSDRILNPIPFFFSSNAPLLCQITAQLGWGRGLEWDLSVHSSLCVCVARIIRVIRYLRVLG